MFLEKFTKAAIIRSNMQNNIKLSIFQYILKCSLSTLWQSHDFGILLCWFEVSRLPAAVLWHVYAGEHVNVKCLFLFSYCLPLFGSVPVPI